MHAVPHELRSGISLRSALHENDLSLLQPFVSV